MSVTAAHLSPTDRTWAWASIPAGLALDRCPWCAWRQVAPDAYADDQRAAYARCAMLAHTATRHPAEFAEFVGEHPEAMAYEATITAGRETVEFASADVPAEVEWEQ